jgi:hypothetical protein
LPWYGHAPVPKDTAKANGAEDGAVVLGERVDRALENPPPLAGKAVLLRALRPVGAQERARTVAVAVGLEGRQEILERRLDLQALAAPLVERRVGADAIDPARQRRASFERRALAREGEEHVLQHFLGVALIARHAEGQAVDPAAWMSRSFAAPRGPSARSSAAMMWARSVSSSAPASPAGVGFSGC